MASPSTCWPLPSGGLPARFGSTPPPATLVGPARRLPPPGPDRAPPPLHGTPPGPPPGGAGPPARLELRAATIVRYPDGLAVPFHGRLGDLAERLGVEFGLPDPPYTPASGCGPDHVAEPDPQALALLTKAWRIGDGA